MEPVDKPFTVRIKVGNNEIELSGSYEDVLKTLERISELVSNIALAFGNAPVQRVVPEKLSQTQQDEAFPTVTIDPATSCPEAITKLLSTEWGRKEPRTLSEILAAMKVNAIHYPEGTVKGRLTDLTKRGVLRRISSRRGYEYILVKP